mmetsp:Transcript_13357/g.30409  ORF Transcript_13357/g.30409 Transcript_13357/m.30409 type:complete len:414 (-) Transcript_13357:1705-2946(-)
MSSVEGPVQLFAFGIWPHCLREELIRHPHLGVDDLAEVPVDDDLESLKALVFQGYPQREDLGVLPGLWNHLRQAVLVPARRHIVDGRRTLLVVCPGANALGDGGSRHSDLALPDAKQDGHRLAHPPTDLPVHVLTLVVRPTNPHVLGLHSFAPRRVDGLQWVAIPEEVELLLPLESDLYVGLKVSWLTVLGHGLHLDRLPHVPRGHEGVPMPVEDGGSHVQGPVVLRGLPGEALPPPLVVPAEVHHVDRPGRYPQLAPVDHPIVARRSHAWTQNGRRKVRHLGRREDAVCTTLVDDEPKLLDPCLAELEGKRVRVLVLEPLHRLQCPSVEGAGHVERVVLTQRPASLVFACVLLHVLEGEASLGLLQRWPRWLVQRSWPQDTLARELQEPTAGLCIPRARQAPGPQVATRVAA